MEKRTIRIADMHCPACVMRVESLEDDLPGVTSARASLRKLSVEVEYDERQVGVEQIIAYLRDLGYQAEEAGGS
jgi:copper chaperone